ncbi:MAG: putative 2OG-Fe(II) oxygenase [Pseudomonadota bacterium]
MGYRQELERAQTLANGGDGAGAVALFRRYIDSLLRAGDHIDGVVWHNFASLQGDGGFHAEAAQSCENAFKAGLQAPETWLVYGRSLQAIGKLDAAEDAFSTALGKRPTDPVVHRDLAQLIWMRTGDAARALVPLTRIEAQFPADDQLKSLRAQIFSEMGMDREAFAQLDALLKKATDQSPWLLPHGEAALRAGHYGPAEESLTRARSQFGDHDQILEPLVRLGLATGPDEKTVALIDRLRAGAPHNQYFCALEATAWRLVDDPRHDAFYEASRLVHGFELKVPRGWRSLGAYLDDLCTALDTRHPFAAHPFGLSVRHGSQLASIEAMDDPALRAFPEAAMGPVTHYLAALADHLPADSPVWRGAEGRKAVQDDPAGAARLLAAWSVRLPANGFHVNHVHPAGWLSSACHLRTVAAVPGDDPRAGWIKFGEPGIATVRPLAPTHMREPQAGVMVMFPSFLWHGTVPFSGSESRLTIAADFSRRAVI